MGGVKTSNSYQERRLREGSLTVQLLSKRISPLKDASQGSKGLANGGYESTMASVSFLPADMKAARIAVTFQQNASYEGFFLRNPTVTISASMSDDAEILIEKGDLAGLLKSPSDGKVHLNDRDEKGRSSLNVEIHRS